MKKIIKLITMVGALNLVTFNSVMLTVFPTNTHIDLHRTNASLLKWKLSLSDVELVKKYETTIHKTASIKSINEFNDLYDTNKTQAIWSNYDSLQYDLTHTKLGGKNIDINWNEMYKNVGLKNQQLQLAQTQQLRFYNIFAKIFHKSNVIRLIQKVAPVAVTDRTVAWTGFSSSLDTQEMGDMVLILLTLS